MVEGALRKGPPVLRGIAIAAFAMACAAAFEPVAAQNSRSLQDMLIAAIRQGNAAAVRSVLAAGVDVSQQAGNGKTALDIAVELKRFDIAEILVRERRVQREAAMAALDARAPEPVVATDRTSVEIVQPSAEAAPDLVRPSAVATARVSIAKAETATPSGPTVEQLLAAARDLTQAAQAIANAHRANVGTDAAPRAVRTASVSAPDFVPTPGRKPEIEEAAVQAELPDFLRETSTAPATTIVVTPRRRAATTVGLNTAPATESAAREPAPQAPSSAVSPPSRRASAPRPKREPADEPDNGLVRAVKGIGGFLGLGPSEETREPREHETATEPRGRAVLPGSANHPPRAVNSREQFRRDRATSPHVPAHRVSDPLSQSKAEEPALPPVASVPVAPVASRPIEHPVSAGALNPFDPDNLPQGAVLPVTDPLGGDTPEIAVAAAKPDLAPAPPPARRATERSRDLPRDVTAGARTARAQPSLPQIPPLRDSTASENPTAVFERSAQKIAAVNEPPREDGSILRDLANAVGVTPAVADDGDLDGAGPDRVSSRAMPIVRLREPLADVVLTLGNSVATNQRPLPRGVAEPDPCIKRSAGSVVFCVVPVDWHPKVDPAFSITTYLYQGSRAIARYDGGRATHFHSLFSSHAYPDVVKYFTARYGQPTDEWKRTIAPFDRPRQANPTMVWRARDSRTGAVTILEVRRYDDTRNVFPDMEHGAVRLYAAGAQRVFPAVTGMDLMAIDWAARSDHNGEGVDPAIANTIRIGR